MSKYYLGIDTSAYTTSLSVIDDANNIILDLRTPLKVEKYKRGLRQQEAIFQHLNNFPNLIRELSDKIDFGKIKTISVSTRPRSLLDSYMPVFKFGQNQAYILSKILKTEYKEFSHQEGHIGSGIFNNEVLKEGRFASFHISGGTTEVVEVNDFMDNLFIDILGGTLDISFGQLIDRIGVYFGYQFPCGNKLDGAASKGRLIHRHIPISIKDKYWTNVSGLENYFKNLIDSKDYAKEDIIFTLFHTISSIIEDIIYNLYNNKQIKNILVTGGVASNSYIRKHLLNTFSGSNVNIFYPAIELCTDNSIGISYLGKNKKGHLWQVIK